MIDEGKLDEARDMVRDMEGSGKYKCAEMLIEECIAQGDVEITLCLPHPFGDESQHAARIVAMNAVPIAWRDVDYDYVYVANMGKADLLKSSITDEQHLALYVKDVVDDVDAGDGEIMREWDAKMTSRGIAVDWEEIL